MTEAVQGQVFEMRDLAPAESRAVEEVKASPRRSEVPVVSIRNSALQSPVSEAPQPRPQSYPAQSGQTVRCAHCQTTLLYPVGAYCVRCPRCSQVTAVQPLRKMMCPYCRATLMFPAIAKLVQCTCRNTFATVPGVYQVQARS